MALGIEQNSIAPSLIQNAGNAMTQIIRDTGRMVEGHITEIQTRKDLGAMAQEIQGLNPQTNEFPMQLIQLASRHPLALANQRGQMAVGVLGKAHSDWRRSIQAVEEFNRDLAMQGFRERSLRQRMAEEASINAKKPVSVYGVGLVDPITGETIVEEGSRGSASAPKTLSPGAILVDAQGNKIAENAPSAPRPIQVFGVGLVDPVTGKTIVPEGRRSTDTPRTLSPGSILVSPTGEKIMENPRPTPTMTPYQSAQLGRSRVNDRIRSVENEISRFDKDIDSHRKMYADILKRETASRNKDEKARLAMEKAEVGRIADELVVERDKRRIDLDAMVKERDAIDTEERSAAVLPPLTPQAAATPAVEEFVLVFDPSGKPGKVRASQLDAALQNGYRRR